MLNARRGKELQALEDVTVKLDLKKSPNSRQNAYFLCIIYYYGS